MLKNNKTCPQWMYMFETTYTPLHNTDNIVIKIGKTKREYIVRMNEHRNYCKKPLRNQQISNIDVDLVEKHLIYYLNTEPTVFKYKGKEYFEGELGVFNHYWMNVVDNCDYLLKDTCVPMAIDQHTCNVCNRSFGSLVGLKQHITKTHSKKTDIS